MTSKIFLPQPKIHHATYEALRLNQHDDLANLWVAGHPGGVRSTAQVGAAKAVSSSPIIPKEFP